MNEQNEKEIQEREKENKRDVKNFLLMIKGSLFGSLIILIVYLISLFI